MIYQKINAQEMSCSGSSCLDLHPVHVANFFGGSDDKHKACMMFSWHCTKLKDCARGAPAIFSSWYCLVAAAYVVRA